MDIPRIQAPIVLVHGLFGFDRLRLGGMTLANYFPGIVDLFVAAGNRVLVPSLSPTAGIVQRAQQLKDFLESAAPQQAVHIIAHSLGGLDARYMISRLDMAGRVLTLTTLGTPHRGTAFADWSVNRLERVLQPVFNLLQIPTQAFFDLTRPACARFNDQAPDAPGVRYFSVAGRHDGSLRNPEWLLPYHIVLEAEGPNDGVVSLASANYGEHLEVWEGDHFSLVNWPNPLGVNRSLGRDPRARYGGLLCRLAAAGY